MIRRAAQHFVDESDADVRSLWSSFHGSLYDLCRDEPLDGEFLSLFQALEAWEAALPGEREEQVRNLREAAAKLSSSGT